MNLKKVGIRIIVITILLLFFSRSIAVDSYLRVALGVFGIGSGFILLLLDGYRHFDR